LQGKRGGRDTGPDRTGSWTSSKINAAPRKGGEKKSARWINQEKGVKKSGKIGVKNVQKASTEKERGEGLKVRQWGSTSY